MRATGCRKERTAPDTGMLHNEINKWCYNVVCLERSTLREADRPDTRGAYQPGSAMPHVAAARAPKQDMPVGDVDLNGDSALGLILLQTPQGTPEDSAVRGAARRTRAVTAGGCGHHP